MVSKSGCGHTAVTLAARFNSAGASYLSEPSEDAAGVWDHLGWLGPFDTSVVNSRQCRYRTPQQSTPK